MSCFVVLFSVQFRLQLSVVRPKRFQVVRIELPCILFLSAPSHKNGFKIPLKFKTRHRDQNKVNK